MKNKFFISAIAVMSIIAFTAVDSYAKKPMRGGMHGDGPGPGCGMGGCPRGMFFGNPERMKEVLGLTDTQVEKIGQINLDFKKKMLDLKEKLEPKKIRLKKLLLEDTVDLTKVRSLLKEISDIKVEIRMLRIMHRLEIEKVLTPAQKTKFRNSRMGMGKGRMHGPHRFD